MSTIIGLSFVAPATARLAFTLFACAGLALLTPTPASRDLDASTATGVVESQASTNPAGDREWTTDVSVTASDACDDDDDDGGDESSSASGTVTFDRELFAPRFSYGARLALAENRRDTRERGARLLRGPPASAQKSFAIAADDTAGPHLSRSVLFLLDPFRSASAASDYLLRAPP